VRTQRETDLETPAGCANEAAQTRGSAMTARGVNIGNACSSEIHSFTVQASD
jgi:hypothetical protein